MVERTTDMDAVSRIFNHPKVYEWISDDTSVPPFIPDPAQFYLMNEEKTGVVRLEHLNGITCMVHIGTLPELWGRATSFVKECRDWAFENTRYTKFVSLAPEYNRVAILFGKRCGFKIEGKLTKSFLKNWKLHDQIVFGLSKYDKEAARNILAAGHAVSACGEPVQSGRSMKQEPAEASQPISG